MDLLSLNIRSLLSPIRQLGLFLFLVCSIHPAFSQAVTKVGTIEHFALTESSGLTTTRTQPGVYWSHNDAGNFPFLFALDRTGRHLGAYEIQGANLIDLEAIAPDYRGNLYLADTGLDGLARSHSVIHRVPEPDASERTGRAIVERSWFFRFPEGPRQDVEAMFILDRSFYLITKPVVNNAVSMYRLSFDAPEVSVLQFVTSIPVRAAVADATISDDTQRLALITGAGVEIIFIGGNAATAGSAYRQRVGSRLVNLEGGVFVPEGVLATQEATPDIWLFSSPFFGGEPGIDSALENQSAIAGTTVEFEVEAFGLPPLTYRWFFEGALLEGQSASTLVLTNVTIAQSGTYSVVVSNAFGSATNSAELTVTASRPELRITEVQSSQVDGALVTEDWWELTSLDDQVVDLSGWRFNDFTGGLMDAFVIPAGVTISPGESIIFVENMSPDDFRAWWGPELKPGLQIITYSGLGLSFSATGDTVRLWDAATGDDSAVFTSVTFGVAEAGISFGYDAPSGVFGARSALGQPGTFQATQGDIGSPGNIAGAVAPAALLVTEVMASPAEGSAPSADWWELTNSGGEAVDLSGWRFNDDTGGFADAFVMPAGLSLRPGESIVFVENLTPDEFKTWWGPENFSPTNQIITYAGTGLGLRAAGDSIRLWDALTADETAVKLRVNFVNAEPGVSQVYDPASGAFGTRSQLGVGGAFTAATGPDLGSPARFTTSTNLVSGLRLQTLETATGLTLQFNAREGETYVLETSGTLAPGSWIAQRGAITATNNAVYVFEVSRPESNRFYRVRQN